MSGLSPTNVLLTSLNTHKGGKYNAMVSLSSFVLADTLALEFLLLIRVLTACNCRYDLANMGVAEYVCSPVVVTWPPRTAS